ncbi:MAG: hypothetical protein U0Y10_24570 [Spirosomataceae bacterium]
MNHKLLLLLFLFSLTVASVWADHLTNSYLTKANAVAITSLTSSLNSSFTGSVTINTTVTSGENPVIIPFLGVQALVMNMILNGSGQATLSKSELKVGSQTLWASCYLLNPKKISSNKN